MATSKIQQVLTTVEKMSDTLDATRETVVRMDERQKSMGDDVEDMKNKMGEINGHVRAHETRLTVVEKNSETHSTSWGKLQELAIRGTIQVVIIAVALLAAAYGVVKAGLLTP